MPCTQTGSLEGDRALAAEEALQGSTGTITTLTQLLCGQCTYLEQTNNARLMTKKVEKWWKNHKEQDRLRAEREKTKQALAKAKQEALKLLTPFQKQALGL